MSEFYPHATVTPIIANLPLFNLPFFILNIFKIVLERSYISFSYVKCVPSLLVNTFVNNI